MFRLGLNVTTTKKGRQLFGEEKCTPRENPGYAYEWKEGNVRRGEGRGEKGPALSWHGAPEWLIRPCLSDDNFRKPWRRKFTFADLVNISPGNSGQVRVWRSSVKVKVTGAKTGRKSIFPQFKTSSGYNSGFVKHRAMMFACSMGFSGMADRIVWQPYLSRDWKWQRVIKCTHSRVLGLRLEGNIVVTKSSAHAPVRRAGDSAPTPPPKYWTVQSANLSTTQPWSVLFSSDCVQSLNRCWFCCSVMTATVINEHYYYYYYYYVTVDVLQQSSRGQRSG